MTEVLLTVSTRKGLFLGRRRDGGTWAFDGPHFNAQAVYSVAIDTRHGPAPRLRLVFKVSSDAFRVAIARVIAAQLAEVGIAVEVRSFEFATFFADVKKGAYQLAMMQTAEITEPDYYFMYFHSSWIPTPANPDGFNRWRYRNPEVDRLTTAGREELDVDKRKRIYAEVQRLVAEDVPIVPLWHEHNVVLTNVDVQGYTMTPNARLIGLRDVTKRL